MVATRSNTASRGNVGADRSAIHGPHQQESDNDQESGEGRVTIPVSRIHGTEESARAESERVREVVAAMPEKDRPKKPSHVYRATLGEKTRFVLAESPQRVAALTFREFGLTIVDLDTGRGTQGYDPASIAEHMSDAEIAAAIAAMQEIAARRNASANPPAAQTQRSAARGR